MPVLGRWNEMSHTWTDHETELLKTKYLNSTNEELVRLFPSKTFIAIYKKARQLGLWRSKEIEFKNRSSAKRRENSSAWNGGRRLTRKGYVQILMPEHKIADSSGYVMEHIAVYERETGIEIPPCCCIHHLNGIKNDNRIENLCMMTFAGHTKYHHLGAKRNEEVRKHISESKRLKNE